MATPLGSTPSASTSTATPVHPAVADASHGKEVNETLQSRPTQLDSSIQLMDLDVQHSAGLEAESVNEQTTEIAMNPVVIAPAKIEENYTSNTGLAQPDPIIDTKLSEKSAESHITSSTTNFQTATRPVRQYVLPDGSIAATGKGLGKGRPGIKRGPRTAQSSASGSAEPSPTPMAQSPAPPSVVANPATPNGTKRKRAESNASNVLRSSVTSSQSRDSTPEYNPTASQTRSGRQTQRPASLITASPAVQSPSTKKSATNSANSTPNFKSHPKIKRRVYKGKEQLALCEHCLRGFGPENNVIVFCDACNKCWHQRCHTPQISKAVVADSKAEWFCATCDKILHGNKKAKKTSIILKTSALPPQPPLVLPKPEIQRYGPPLIGAVALTLDQQKAYLNTLSKERLINMVLHAGNLAPQLPMFETPLPAITLPTGQIATPPKPQPQFASNYRTPVDPQAPEIPGSAGKANANDVNDEGYDDRFDEHALLYPKAGQGIQMPPDRADMHMLLEGPDSRTFSHWVRGINMKNYLDNVTLVQG